MQYILFFFRKQKEKSCLSSGHHQPLLKGKEQHEHSAKHLIYRRTNVTQIWNDMMMKVSKWWQKFILGWTISSKISRSRPLLEFGGKTTFAVGLDNHWRFLRDKPIEKLIEVQSVYIYLSLSTYSKMHASIIVFTYNPTLNMYLNDIK